MSVEFLALLLVGIVLLIKFNRSTPAQAFTPDGLERSTVDKYHRDAKGRFAKYQPVDPALLISDEYFMQVASVIIDLMNDGYTPLMNGTRYLFVKGEDVIEVNKDGHKPCTDLKIIRPKRRQAPQQPSYPPTDYENVEIPMEEPYQ